MTGRPPGFWSRADGADSLAARLLRPLGRLYGALVARRIAGTLAWRADRPVICVGNASMGGVGKTPFAMLLARTLAAEGLAPGFLTRGYGGKAKGPLFVTHEHDAREVGDEALLLARVAPTMLARERVDGVRAMAGDGAPRTDAVIMDDGYQNPSLVKDLSFLLVDAEARFGNGLVFPAGPLREPPQAALARADAVVVVTKNAQDAVPEELRAFAGDMPLLQAWLEPVHAEPDTGGARKVVAFCGIGRPQKFYDTARAAGYEIAATRDFPDHHVWRGRDLAALEALAREHEARLITTEKDHVRLPASLQRRVTTLPVRMAVDDPALLRDILSPVLARAPIAGAQPAPTQTEPR